MEFGTGVGTKQESRIKTFWEEQMSPSVDKIYVQKCKDKHIQIDMDGDTLLPQKPSIC